MVPIQQVTTDPLQRQTLQLPNGTSLELQIYYRPMQLGWFFNSIVNGDFVLKGVRITVSPNMLHQFRNQISFGIGCFSKQNREPTLQEDFSSGAAKLYLLDATDVARYAEILRLG